jgi:DNA-directed RNA polymerase specialized sigma24 family protein
VTWLHPSRDEIRRLYDAHGRTLLAYGYALLNDAAAAEDVLHQVFARLLRGGLRIQGDPLPWLIADKLHA